jgi:hypothetical protein
MAAAGRNSPDSSPVITAAVGDITAATRVLPQRTPVVSSTRRKTGAALRKVALRDRADGRRDRHQLRWPTASSSTG